MIQDICSRGSLVIEIIKANELFKVKALKVSKEAQEAQQSRSTVRLIRRLLKVCLRVSNGALMHKSSTAILDVASEM